MNSKRTFHTTSARTAPPVSMHGSWVALLVLALLWAQALGLAHRVWHAPLQLTMQVAAQSDKILNAKAGVIEHLLAPMRSDQTERSDAACLSVDQLGLAETLLAAPLLVLAVVQPHGLMPVAVHPILFSSCTHYLARAPPQVL